MKITAMVAMAAAVGMSAQAEQKVTVYMQDGSVVPAAVLRVAEFTAAKMFAGVGVRIDWRTERPAGAQLPRERAITVSMAAHTPAAYLPGALASAQVYEGVHITVFWDRVEQGTRAASRAMVLAHVLVHEITHILQGIERHSDSGVMKASWTNKDYEDMAWKPLPFTPQDIRLIHIGLAE